MTEETTPNQPQPEANTPPQPQETSTPPVPQSAPSMPPQLTQEPKKSSAMLYTIITLVALLLIAGIAAGIYYYMDKSQEEEPLNAIITEPEPDIRDTQLLPETEDEPEPARQELTPGNTIEEIEQDLGSFEFSDLDSELSPIEGDIEQVD